MAKKKVQDRGWLLEMAADFIAPFEGFSPKVYKCPAGHLTFGFGSLIKNHKDVVCPITVQEARQYMMMDLEPMLKAIDKLVKVDIGSNQLVALLSFVYNLGQGNLGKSTLLKLLNDKKYEEAADEFLKWNKAMVNGKLTPLRGLTARREAERQKFLMDISRVITSIMARKL